MKSPKFSIIIPVRKINPYLQETLLKLKKQSLKNFEILVITDKISGSANPSEKRNLGAQKAKGQYLAFLDDDSYPHENYFKNASKLVEKNPEFAAFCGPCLTPPKDNIYQKSSGLFWSSWLGSGGAGIYRNSIQKQRFVNDYPSVNLIVKKSDFNLAGGFDTSYWPGEDTVLCLYLTKNFNKKIFYHPSLIVFHHRRSVIIPHLQQITRYAIQRGFFVKKFPETSFKLGYFIPTFFLFYLILLTINYLTINYNLLYIPLYLYLSILFFTFLIFIFQKNKLFVSLLAAITIPITHLYYGILFLHGLSKKEVKFKAHAFNKKLANISAVKSVSISYPPLESDKGSPFLSQNRQFQWTNTGNVIYPVIPAYAATLLKSKGINIFWDDAIAQNLTYLDWFKRLKKNKPDLIVIETKTPVIKKHWQIINQIKREAKWTPIIVLIGDHITALPEESIKNSHVDYVLIGGDYDFLLDELISLINSNNSPKDKIFKLQKQHELNSLPIIDRKLTQWQLYAYNNTNYKYKPGSYIMSGRDCWWGRCTFCSWTTLFPGKCFRHFSVEHTLNEIENLVYNFGVKEIFDDSGTLPIGPWLKELCQALISSGLNKKVKIGCNMRFDALSLSEYQLMHQAGFRFVLYGLESANQKTLDFVNKNEKTSAAIRTLKIAKKAKIEPHVTVMIGYPDENKEDAQKTLNLARKIFKDGLADSLQATIIIPYPGTPLFKYCQDKKLLLTTDWDNFDMRQSIIKSPISPKDQIELVQSLFKGILTPNFIFKKITSIRSFSDIKHLTNYAIKYFQKLKDFQNKK